MTADKVYFDDNVIITPSIATFFGTSYPIAAISSLTVRTQKNNRRLPLVIGAIGLLLFVVGLLKVIANLYFMFAFNESDPEVFIPGLVSTLIGAAAIAKASSSKHPPPDFCLVLVTAAGERAAVTSKDQNYTNHIRACIEHAIQGGTVVRA